MKYFIANWKANKTTQDTEEWLTVFLKNYKENPNVVVIICPPFPFILQIKEKIAGYGNLKVGAQDVSCFEEGTYTGEVTAKSLQGAAEYCIVGHSERRSNLKETEGAISDKIKYADKYGLAPIYCFQGADKTIPKNVKFLAYEPPWAISSGYEDSLKTTIEETPENAVEVRKKLKIAEDKVFIYGGSVNPSNIARYLKHDEIDGFLIGGASLNPLSFCQIINTV